MASEIASELPIPARPAPPISPPSGEAARRSRRLAAAFVFVACATLLGIAAWLEPNPSGIGTHEQLHLPPCGWTTSLGLPCPTCGMTTAFASAADGDLARSFLAQPFGCLLAIATAATTVVSAHVAVTGSAVGGCFARLLGPKVGWIILGLALAAWAFKIAAFRGLHS